MAVAPDRLDCGWCTIVPPQGFALAHAAAADNMPGGSALLAPQPSRLPQKSFFSETFRDRAPDAFPESISIYAGLPALAGPPEAQLRASLDALRHTLGPLGVEKIGPCDVGGFPGAAAHFIYHAGFPVALLSVAWDLPRMRCTVTMHAPARRGAQRLCDITLLAASLQPAVAP